MGILSAFPGKSKPILQSKTVTPTTSTQNVTPDSEYDGLDKVTINRIPTSYVLPSATQSAKTWTPGTSNQYIPAGTYCSGQQTIQGDADLKASNIKSGVNIFGVTGTYAGDSVSFGTPVKANSTNNPVFTLNTTNLKGFYVYAESSAGDYDDEYSIVAGLYTGSAFYVMSQWSVGGFGSDVYGGDIIGDEDNYLPVTISSNSITINTSNSSGFYFSRVPNLIPIYG